MTDNIDNLDTIEDAELELKKLDYKIKYKNFTEKSCLESPLIIGILTVILSFLGSYLISQSQINQSKKTFNTTLIEGVMDNEVHITKRKIEFLIASGQLEEDKVAVKSALKKLSIKSAPFYYQKGIERSSSKDDYSAIQQFDIAIELDSTNFEFYQKRATSYLNLGNSLSNSDYLQKSIYDLIKSNSISKSYLNSFKIAEIYFSLKEFEKSIISVKKSLELQPNCYKCYDLKGDILIKQQKLEDACRAYLNSNNILPQKDIKIKMTEYCQ